MFGLRWTSVAGPTAFAVVGIALLIFDHLNQGLPALIFWLTLFLIITVFVRMIDTMRRQSGELEEIDLAAYTDHVTGLRSKQVLGADMATVLSSPGERRVLILFELEALQDYNDSMGHAAGDQMLRGFARELAVALEPLGGIAYRSDGGRIAALAPGGQHLGEIVLSTTASLRDERGALLNRTYGDVTIPDEATDPEDALRIARQRLAAHKQRQQRSARRQAHGVLMAVLAARRPDLRDGLRIVAYRAIALARKLGMSVEQIDDIALAAELQDIGLLAVPEPVLEKEADLSETERAMIRSHSVEGERIVAAAPDLASVAALVRSAAEHYDGSGYPDGLAGEAIPLGARIIAVAVAFAAMTSRRPHRPPLSVDAALAELRRCAGRQFDPRVVEALAADLVEETASAAV